MIRLLRPATAPTSFKRASERQTQRDCTAFDASPDSYRSGELRFQYLKFSAKAMKELLVKMHSRKCCYCEKKLRTSAYLHVEHFRPRGGVRQSARQKVDEFPGYYWLAYRWENFLLSCHDCNSIHKCTLFPLANPKQRARSHHDDAAKERPLFIDPVGQDPRDHIRFEDDLPIAITRHGRATINGMGLRRSELREERLEVLRHIKVLYDFLALAVTIAGDTELQAKVQEAREFIKAAVMPNAEFSSMVFDYVDRHPLL